MEFSKSYPNIRIKLFLGLLCFSFSQPAKCNNKSIYLGKNLTELANQDNKLNSALNQTWWDVYCFKINYFYFKSPSMNHINIIKNNISLFDKIIQEIKDCTIKTDQELSILKNKKYNIPGNDSTKIVAAITLLPWYFVSSCFDTREIKKKENQINIMICTKQELEEKIKVLNKIINTYER